MTNFFCFTFQTSAAFIGWGDDTGDWFCANLKGIKTFENQASSLRFTGAPDGFKYDSINFYEFDSFMGFEQYSYGDLSSLNRPDR